MPQQNTSSVLSIKESESDKRVRLLFFSIFIIVPNVFYFKALDVFNFPKQAVFLILTIGLIPFVLNSLISLKESKFERIMWGILFFTPLLSLSFSFPVQSTAIWGTFTRANGLLTTMCCIVLALAIRLHTSGVLLYFLPHVIILVSFLQSIYASIQLFGIDPIDWNNPYAPIITTLGNPNFASAMLGFLAIWCFGFGISHKSVSTRSHKIVAKTSLFLFPILAWLCFKTTSIQGYVGLAIGIAFLLLVRFSLFSNSKFMKYSGISLGTSLTAVGLLGLGGKGPLAGVLFQDTLQVRMHYWKVGFEMMIENPLGGVGPDAYGDYYMLFRDLEFVQQRGSQLFTNNAHSILFQWGATFGVIGFVSILIVFVGTILRYLNFRQKIRNNDSSDYWILDVIFTSWLSIAIVLMVSIEQIGLSILYWGFLGIVWGITDSQTETKSFFSLNSRSTRSSRESAMRHRQEKKTNSNLLLASSLVMVVASYPATRHISNDLGLRSAISLPGAKQGIDNQSLELRGKEIYKFAKRLSGDRDYLTIAVDNLFVNGPGEIAKQLCEETLDESPRHINAMSCLSIFYENTGDFQKAIEFRLKMLNVDPLNYLNFYRIGRLYSLAGNKIESKVYLMKSLELDSDDPAQVETKILLSELNSG